MPIMTITKQLKRLIETSGMSRYEISKRSGVAQGVLSQFVTGKRAMTTDTLDKLAPVLGLTLSSRIKAPRKGK